MARAFPFPFPLLNWHISLHKHKHWSQGVEGEGELKKDQFEWDNMSPCAFKFSLAPFFRSVQIQSESVKRKNAIRTVGIRTAVALFSHRCRIALLAFARLTFALLSHSHCWPLRTVGIRTVGFALVSFALLSFALLSYKRSAKGETKSANFWQGRVLTHRQF